MKVCISIPGAVEVRNLVGEELNEIEHGSNADDPPTGEDVEFPGQAQIGEAAQQAKRGYRRVQIDSRDPPRSHRNRQRANQVHCDYLQRPNTTSIRLMFIDARASASRSGNRGDQELIHEIPGKITISL